MLKTTRTSGKRPVQETIVFFGSGPVAAASLKFILQNFSVEAVITKKLPPHHKGTAPVEQLARMKSVPIYFANTGRELDEVLDAQKFNSPAGIIVDYGVIVSQKAIEHFRLGIINSHFSLLPKWRGADPITFTILSGDSETGVSIMRIVEDLDEGDLLSQEPLALPDSITAPELIAQLIKLSNQLLARDIPRYLAGELIPYPQPATAPSYSRKLTKADGIIDWTKPAVQIEREIRAFLEWPKSHATLAGKDVIITQAHVAGYEYHAFGEVVGKAFPTPEGLLGVATGEGILIIDKLKPAGKNEMSGSAFLAGYGKHL